jgi:LEA14-like dessication related protein
MKMTRRHGLVLLAISTLLAACAPRIEQPEVWLENVRLASLGLTGGVIEVQLSVHNPNRFAVEASGLTYDLALRARDADDWVEFTEGRLDEGLRVAARDTLELAVPVQFSYRGLGQAARGLVDQGSFEYRVSGVVELRAPVRRELPYQRTGLYTAGGTD